MNTLEHRPRQVPGPAGAEARLLVAGDTHGNLKWIRTLSKLAARHGCDGVVQLGDFGFWPDKRISKSQHLAVINHGWLTAVADTAAKHGVWWRVIDGNHDAHRLARAAFPPDSNGVRPIRDGVLDWADRGAVWEWCGIRIGALGGAPSMDREHRVEGRTWWPTEEISARDVSILNDRAGPRGVDVLLSHDSPLLPPRISPLVDPTLARLCATSQSRVNQAINLTTPTLVLHGHYHRRWSGRHLDGARVEGIASDQEARQHHTAWTILTLPTLGVGLPEDG